MYVNMSEESDSADEKVVMGSTPFDDGVCGRKNISVPCTSHFTIPRNLTAGSLFTVYWLWDYSGKLGRNVPHVEVSNFTRIAIAMLLNTS